MIFFLTVSLVANAFALLEIRQLRREMRACKEANDAQQRFNEQVAARLQAAWRERGEERRRAN